MYRSGTTKLRHKRIQVHVSTLSLCKPIDRIVVYKKLLGSDEDGWVMSWKRLCDWTGTPDKRIRQCWFAAARVGVHVHVIMERSLVTWRKLLLEPRAGQRRRRCSRPLGPPSQIDKLYTLASWLPFPFWQVGERKVLVFIWLDSYFFSQYGLNFAASLFNWIHLLHVLNFHVLISRSLKLSLVDRVK